MGQCAAEGLDKINTSERKKVLDKIASDKKMRLGQVNRGGRRKSCKNSILLNWLFKAL